MATRKLKNSLATLILVNLVPVAGAVFLNWDVYAILFLFWFETIAILGVDLLRVILISSASGSSGVTGSSYLVKHCFMLVWGGMFTFIHGVFVICMIGPLLLNPNLAKINANGSGFSFQLSGALLGESLGSLLTLDFALAVLTVTVAQGWVLFAYWRKSGGSERLTASSPSYVGRITLLHITMLIGSMVMVLKQVEHGMIFVFVGLKLAIDLLFYFTDTADDEVDA